MAEDVKQIGTAGHSAQTGTLNSASLGATSLTGSGTAFTTDYTTSDRLIIDHAGTIGLHSYDITAIGSATSITIAGGLVAAIGNGTTHYKQGSTHHYSTITAWEAAINNTTYPLTNTQVKGECYNDSNFDEDVTINATATNVDEVKLSVASGERHDGTSRSGAMILASTGRKITLATPSGYDNKYILEWLEIDQNGKSEVPVDGNSATAGNTGIVRNCILHDVKDAGGFYFINAPDRDLRVVRNICYDLERNTTGEISGFRLDADRTQGGCFGNTVYKVNNPNATGHASGIRCLTNSANHQCKNNISMNVFVGGSGNALDFNFAGTNIDSETNMSEDASADDAGGTHQISKNKDTQFVSNSDGTEDFHLVSGSNAIDNGTDLGNTLTGAEIDIDGFNCHTDTSRDPWDIGAHERDPGGGGGGGDVFFENRHPIAQGMKPLTAAGISGVLVE